MIMIKIQAVMALEVNERQYQVPLKSRDLQKWPYAYTTSVNWTQCSSQEDDEQNDYLKFSVASYTRFEEEDSSLIVIKYSIAVREAASLIDELNIEFKDEQGQVSLRQIVQTSKEFKKNEQYRDTLVIKVSNDAQYG